MILLLDASAYLKLYVAEPGTGIIKKLVGSAAAIYAPQSAYVEIRSILSRSVKNGIIREKQFANLVTDFERDWAGTSVIAPDQPMMRDAAVISERYGLDVLSAQNIAAGARLSREFPPNLALYCTACSQVYAAATQEGIRTQQAA